MSSLKLISLLFVSCACTLAQDGDWRSPIQNELLSQYKMTRVTADKATIVTPCTVVVLRKDDLVLYATGSRYANGNTYKGGRITQGFFGVLGKTARDGSTRTFVAGEKLWLTRIAFEAKGDGVILEFLSDPFDDVRYWGTLKFQWPKGSPPTPDEFAATVAQVMKPDDAAPSGAPAAAQEIAQLTAAPPSSPALVEQARRP
jgi:hypothetical protein